MRSDSRCWATAWTRFLRCNSIRRCLGPDRLAEPLGNYSPFALMWTFMGYSKPYTIFAGVGEVIGGVLLLFRKTTTLGASLSCGVMANVLALDSSYGVGLRVLVSLYLLLAIFLLAAGHEAADRTSSF